MNECFCCSVSSPAFNVVGGQGFGHSNRYIVVSHCCISLLTYVEHLFLCLFVICISSSVRCLLRSLTHFLIGCCFLIVNFKSSLCISDMCAYSLSHVQLFVTPWTVVCQAPLSMGFSRQEYWIGLPFPPPRNWTHASCVSCIGKWILYHWATWKTNFLVTVIYQLCLLQIFLLVCSLSFLSLNIVFHRAEVFNLVISSLSIISFTDHALVMYLKSHHHIQDHLDFLLCYILGVI